MIRLAIIGMGEMGSKYASMILNMHEALFDIVATTRIKDVYFNRIQKDLKQTLHIYPTDQALFEAYDQKEFMMDACLIVTPHYRHEYAVSEALKRHIHVLCDKPAGVYLRQGRNMLVHKTDQTVYNFIFQQRTYPIYHTVKSMIDSKKYGEVKRMSYIVTDWYRTDAYYKSAPWRATYQTDGGGTLINQCPHSLDLLCYLFGRPDEVFGMCHEGKYHDIEVEDEVTSYMSWNHGLTGVFIASTGETPGVNRLEISFEKALVTISKDTFEIIENEFCEMVYRKMPLDHQQSPSVIYHEKTRVEHDVKQGYLDILHNFYHAIVNHEKPIATGLETLDSLYLSNAIYLSSAKKSLIKLYPIGSKESIDFEIEFEAWLASKSRN